MSSGSLFGDKKRSVHKYGLRFYFILFVSIALFISSPIAELFSQMTQRSLDVSAGMLEFLGYVFSVAYALIVGIIMSYLISKIMIVPINKLQRAMNSVAEGNFDVADMEDSNVHEINDLGQAFNVMMHELRSTEIIQSDFVTNVSHEFKTPLYAIEGYATLLQDDSITADEKKEYIERILSGLKRVNKLIANVLLLSKVDNQAIVGHKQNYSLDEQIRQTIVATEPVWSEKNIEFDVEMDSVDFVGDESMISHVWNNLIGNAVKFSPSGGLVKIRLTERDDIINFSVEDRGPGITEQTKKRLFDKFYQGDTSHKEEGNGLGLALVKKILDLVGGTIDVHNVDPCGCVFTVTLPRSVKALE